MKNSALLYGLIERCNSDPKGDWHVVESRVTEQHSQHRGPATVRIELQATGRVSPYDNMQFTVEAYKEQDAIDRVERILFGGSQ